MFEYAVYIRTNEGYIERMNNVISNLPYDSRKTYGSLSPYVHGEELVGFPESVVLWENSTGPSVGIAPINPSSHSTDANPPP
ncbi:hypothetical protein SAMN05216316_2653 [Nitrosovibrio sp. Nv6]|nr:hypothetical protein SAMN05216316_2653 [Nitrosovibrio sp. Nv6]